MQTKPLARAISWLDTRTLIEGEDPWTDLDKEQLYQKNGWPYFGTFPLAHLGWLKKNKARTLETSQAICDAA